LPRTIGGMVAHVTNPSAALLDELPSWVTLVRAANPGPMTLDGTNSWVLRAPGHEQCIVIDPGPLMEDHLVALSRHGEVRVILATHGHPDHVEGLPRFRELVPTGTLIPGRDGVGVTVHGGLRLEALATPGHTADSVSFIASYEGQRVVFTGDTILGRGTTVVAHPDGDLGDYLHSLRRLIELGPLPVLPGHGPAMADCAAAASFYLDHRLARLEQVREARAAGRETAADIVASVYADVDQKLWPAAKLSVQSQLAYLDREPR
jgi:glyoxylase-like metal-dependent hydrolase (beta-lactamase superfamily II)